MQPLLSMVAANDLITQNQDNEVELQKLRQVVVHLTKLSGIGTTAAMIVHEVAQPVTAATNYLAAAQRLLTVEQPETQEQALEAVVLAQDCLLRTAEIMRNVKEAASNKAFRAKSLDLHEVVADVMKLYSATWGLTPKVLISTTACRVWGDEIQLAQVLSNLIRNAMEATEGQSERRLSVSSRLADDDTVEIRVEDNGPGIPLSISEKLFSAFSSTKSDGLGVGLSICRAIVEQHQGRIWAESLPDGTAFCFTLPVVDAAAPPAGMPASADSFVKNPPECPAGPLHSEMGGAAPDRVPMSADTPHETLAVLLDQSLDCVKFISPAGTVEHMNKNGLSAMEIDDFSVVRGKLWSSLWPEASRSLIEDSLMQASDGKHVRFDAFCPTAKATPRWWDVSVSKVWGSNREELGFLAVSRDVTEARAAREAAETSEEHIKSLQAQLLHLARVNAMGSMAATLAHELNQPLTAIANYARGAHSLLRDGAAPSEVGPPVDAIVECALRAGKIIKSVREMAKRGTGAHELVNPNRIVKDAAAFALVGSCNSTKVKLNLADGVSISADPLQLQQVMINLIRNGCDAVQGCDRTEVTVSTCISGDEVRFEVCDTGDGIPAHHLATLFDAFFTTKRNGTGIGLSISRTIVEAHRGRIWAENRPEGGAQVSFSLPLVPAAKKIGKGQAVASNRRPENRTVV